MKPIYKYQIYPQNDLRILMKKGAEILTAQLQSGVLYMWALVDDEEENEMRKLLIIGTGHDARNVGKYIATVQSRAGAYVWHIFEAP